MGRVQFVLFAFQHHSPYQPAQQPSTPAPQQRTEEEDGEVLLRRGVEALGHASVLRAALAHEDDRHAVIIRRRDAELAVEEDRARGAHGVWELLANEGPAALEEGVFVVDVHGAAGALAGAGLLGEELGHDRLRIDAARQGVGVLAVV